jgi:hypothetical protein
VLSLFLLITPLSSGLVLNLSFLASLDSLFLLLNPLYLHFSLFASLYLQDACELSYLSDSLFNDQTLCQSLLMALFGYDVYGDQSGALIILMLWIVLLNLLALAALYVSTFQRGIVFNTTQTVKETLHRQREVVILQDRTTASASAAATGVDSVARKREMEMSQRQPIAPRVDLEGDVDSSLSSRESDEANIRTPSRPSQEVGHGTKMEAGTEDHQGINSGDVSLAISHEREGEGAFEEAEEQPGAFITPIGLPLSEYQLTAQYPSFQVYQSLYSVESEESQDMDRLSVLLVFRILVTKRDILASVEETAHSDTLTIGVVSPEHTEGEQEGEDGRREPDLYELPLLQRIDSASLRSKFNKHQCTLHLTAQAIATITESEGEEEGEAEGDLD